MRARLVTMGWELGASPAFLEMVAQHVTSLALVFSALLDTTHLELDALLVPSLMVALVVTVQLAIAIHALLEAICGELAAGLAFFKMDALHAR